MSYVQRIIDQVKAKDPDQPEFIQAVTEVMSTLEPVIEAHPEYEEAKILERITEGKGEDGDIEKLENLANTIKATALCGLGQTAPNPVLSTLKYFRDESEAHIYEKRCPAGHCKKLLTYKIDPAKCKGCTLCARNCPAGCISGKVREAHYIDTTKCLKCGACMEKCKFGAISRS